MADKIRRAYLARRTEHVRISTKNPAAVYRLPDMWKNRDGSGLTIWDRMARQVINHRLIPELIVSVAFRWFSLRLNKAPMPTQLLSQSVLNAYRQQYPVVTEDIAERNLRLEMDSLRSGVLLLAERHPDWPVERVRESCLVDSSLSLSPLFRFCAARAEGLDRIAEIYEPLAGVQFSPSWRAYLTWGDFIPADFREKNREF